MTYLRMERDSLEVADPLISCKNGVSGHLRSCHINPLPLSMADELTNISRMNSVNDVENICTIWLSILPICLGEIEPSRILRLDHMEHVLDAELIK